MAIPKVIIQTGESSRNRPVASGWTAANPEYEYKYFDNAACAAFLNNHFGRRAVRAFWGLRPGAFKADLFRYAYLFVHGGVYIDLDCVPVSGVTLDVILPPGCGLVAGSERRGIPGIWQAFLACRPGIPGLRMAVTRICSHVEARWHPARPPRGGDAWMPILSITGPVLLAAALAAPTAPGTHDVSGLRMHLYELGHAKDCPMLDQSGRALLYGTSVTHVRTKERYDVLVYAGKAYW